MAAGGSADRGPGGRGPTGAGPGTGGGRGAIRSGAQQGRGGFSSGMFGATQRRTSVPQREYDMNLNNAAELTKTTLGFLGGPVTTAGKMIAGYGPQFTGYRGMGFGPGSYDPTNRALQGGDQMAGGYPPGLQGMLMQAGMYRGGQQGTLQPQQQAMVQQAPRPPAIPQQPIRTQRPGMQLLSGLPGYSAYRPGYSFIGKGGAFS